MARQKFDGVVEVVHLKPDGQVDWVRAYLRRGAAFSDHIKLDRSTLVEQIKSGKRYLTGKPDDPASLAPIYLHVGEPIPG